MAMIKNHGRSAMRPWAAAAGRQAVGSGSGGSDRIGDDLAKIDLLLKSIVLS